MFPNVKYVAQRPNTQVKRQNISVQIPNNHPKLLNHHQKYPKYHLILNHQIPDPKSETSLIISNSLSTIPDNSSRIQNAPPQSQMRHPKYNVYNPKHWNAILDYKKYQEISKNIIANTKWARGPTVRPEKVANWALHSWAPGPGCPGPKKVANWALGPGCPGLNCLPLKSGKFGPRQLGPGAQLSRAQLSRPDCPGPNWLRTCFPGFRLCPSCWVTVFSVKLWMNCKI